MSYTMSRRVVLQLTGAAAMTVAVAGPAAAADSQILVSDGKARSVVLIPVNASEQLLWAASELVRVIGRSTGVTLPSRTVTDADRVSRGDGTVLVCVGFTLPGSDPSIASRITGLDPDGTVIAPDGNTLTLIGATDWGSRHAVQQFLESAVGVRWLFPTDVGEDVPLRTSLRMPMETAVDEPSFTSRVMYPHPGEEIDWRVRTTPSQKWGDKIRTHWRIQFHHKLYAMFDSRKFGDPMKPDDFHPEWYPIIDGKPRIPAFGSGSGWQPRFRAPGLVEEAVRQIVEFFDANPQAPSFSLGVTDGSGFSEDELVGAVGNSVGVLDLSPVYWEFVNKVVTAVVEQRPQLTDKLFGALAYLYVNDPPPFKLHPQVVPYLTRERYRWVDPRLAREDQLHTERWLKVAKQVGWYDYIYGNPYCIPRTPLDLYDVAYDWAKRVGVVGVMAELNPNWGEGPKPWAFAQKLWDSSRSMKDLADEWYERVGGRGAGAQALRSYFAVWEEIWLDRVPKLPFFRAGSYLTYFPFDDMSYVAAVTPADIARAERALERAQAATRGVQAQRVQIIADEFAYTKASALSYPVQPVAPKNRQAALALLRGEVAAVAEKVDWAKQRGLVWDSLNADQDLRPRASRFDRFGAAWSGWNCKAMITLSDYVRAGRDGAAEMRKEVADLQDSAASSAGRDWCRHLLLMIDGEAHRYGDNLGFESGENSGWTFTPNPATATRPQVVKSPARSGSHSLRLDGGYITCGVNQTDGVYPAGEGVWVTRFRYHVPPGSAARGVLVPGIRAYDWAGAEIGYRQDHYVPMVDGAGTWAEARYTDKLPAGTVTVRPVLVSAYHGLDSQLYLDDFEFLYYGDLSDGAPPPGTVLVEQGELRLTSGRAEIVTEAAADDQHAARLVGGGEAWAVQYPLAGLPTGQTYRIAARVRVDLAPEAVPTTLGVGLGVYRPTPRFDARTTYAVSQFVGKGYQWLNFPGAHQNNADGMTLYVTAYNSSVEHVYVDRLCAIPL